MQYCPDCGSELRGSESFCSNCGVEIDSYRNSPQQTQQTRQPRDNTRTPQQHPTNEKIVPIEVRILGVIVSIVAIAGVFMPWVAVEISTFLGQSASEQAVGLGNIIGLTTLILGIVAGGLFFADDPDVHLLASALGLLGLLLTLFYMNDPLQFSDLTETESALASEAVELKIGVFVTAAAHGGALLFGLIGYTTAKN